MTRILGLLVFLLSLGAKAEVIETWVCKDKYEYSSWTTIVTAKVHSEKNAGSIKVAGITHDAQYRVKGFYRRWDFGGLTKDGSYNYAFVLKPNGDGYYYDFSRAKTWLFSASVDSSQSFKCRESN